MSTPTERSPLQQRLRTDLTAAMKSRDQLRTSTLRLALAAVKDAEVAGDTARSLDDAEVLKVLTREVKKRREAAEAFAEAGRAESAERERAEGEVLGAYLPRQLGDDELTEIIDRVLGELGLSGPRAIGPVMKSVQAEVAGRAEGGRVAALVKARLIGG
ncbi:GatB/YqeY domain-containing protein [Frankia sp. AgKG'84/4]|uniref:GatB/YqeY domain-containing protein n=1 Tax=Frankia sp. AgKG'84/4 TaxID=573490 RepID=UPI00200DB8B2|nr:GatB/YqeY domain-containing protein [Frankia sp. AgKG'84/4]MCL9792944.1 GatB/YqeY domain-containing protein [Frankia sp. AgKG'84/4]